MSGSIEPQRARRIQTHPAPAGQRGESAIVTVRCGRTRKDFFVRVDPIADGWLLAAVVRPPQSKKPGMGVSTPVNRALRGRLVMGANYPGCPYCRRPTVVRCECGGVTCAPPPHDEADLLCPWCQSWGRRAGRIERLEGSMISSATPNPSRQLRPDSHGESPRRLLRGR